MSKRITVFMILAAFVVSAASLTCVAQDEYKEALKVYEESSKSGYLGVYLQSIDRDLKEALELESRKGALIAGVVDDSPADEAGLEEEDVVVEFDGKMVRNSSQLTRWIKKRSPGDKVDLVVIRDGKKQNIAVVLGKRPKSELRIVEPFLENLYMPKAGTYSLTYFSGSRIGVKVQSLTEQLGEYFGVEDGQGALITEVEEDMPAEKAGLKAGDVIVEADGEDIDDTGDLVEVISEKEEGEKVQLTVMRDRSSRSFEVEVEKSKAWSSSDWSDFATLKVFTDKLQKPEKLWLQKESSELEEEMEELREELEELKEELEELREKLR
jgi:C-terminal processing protease CtpA/Prc